MAKEVTMKDIASKLGISTVSVSKALTGKEGVSDEMRALIKNKAREMGYTYSVTKSGKASKKYIIAVLVEEHFVKDNTSAFYFRMYQKIVSNFSSGNYSTILELLNTNMIEYDVLPHTVEKRKVDGIIVMGKVQDSYLKAIKETKIPVVFLDYYDRDMEVPSVITDNTYGTYMLMNHLFSYGHEKIAFVGDIYATPSILDRYLGYLRGLIVKGITPRADYLICDRDAEGNFLDLELPEDMPTAFVCNCDEIANVLANKLKRLAYQIPTDISIVGFDNSPVAEYMEPNLTTIAVDMDAMTETACDLLEKVISGEGEIKGRKVISGQIIYRNSVSQVKKENE